MSDTLPPLLATVLQVVDRRITVALRRGCASHRTDWLIAELAARQNGVVATRQLLRLDITEAAIRRRAGADRLHRIDFGVYAVGHREIDRNGRRRSALLVAGQDAAISHRSAGHLQALRGGDGEQVHVTVPCNGGRRRPWIHRCASLSPLDVELVRGFRCTTVPRTLVDLAGIVGRRELVSAVRAADYVGRLDVGAVAAAAGRVDRPRGIRVLRAILVDYEDHPGVPFTVVERGYERLCVRHDVPLGIPQRSIPGSTRRVDVLYREAMLAVELDGRSAHARLAALADDRRRDAELAALGYLTLRFARADLTGERAAVTAALVRRTLARRNAHMRAAA
jgi:Protein of unknown function (DUF559)/Transcriptional regulator, AbiEi antitoxin